MNLLENLNNDYEITFHNKELICKNSSGKWCKVKDIKFANLGNIGDKEHDEKFQGYIEVVVFPGEVIPELNEKEES